jgi:hypothetical protein
MIYGPARGGREVSTNARGGYMECEDLGQVHGLTCKCVSTDVGEVWDSNIEEIRPAVADEEESWTA